MRTNVERMSPRDIQKCKHPERVNHWKLRNWDTIFWDCKICGHKGETFSPRHPPITIENL